MVDDASKMVKSSFNWFLRLHFYLEPLVLTCKRKEKTLFATKDTNSLIW